MLDTENYIPPLIGKHSSEDLDELANVSDILIWECDANWVFVHLYGDAKPVTGVSSNELVGKCMLDFLNPSDRQLLAVEQLSQAKEGTNWRRFTLKWQNPDQSQLSIQHALKARFDSDGQITGFLGSSTDVTPIKHYDEQLLNNRTYFWEVDADLNVVFVSENFNAITGRNTQDHLGRHISHIRDGREFLEFGGLIADYFANPRPFSALESSIRTVDGKTLHVESNGFPIFDESGKLKGWRGSNTDITAEIEHKREISKAIQQLNEISRGTRTWFWEVDNDLKFTYLSDSIEDITGYRKDELLQKKVYILHPEEVVQDISKNHPAHLQQGKALRNLKRIVKTKSGELLHCSTSSVPLFDKNGLLIGYQGSSTDYTEEYQMREEWHMAHSRDQLLLDSFPDSLFRITSDGYVLDIRTSEEHELHQYINEYQNHYINDLFPTHRAEFFMGGIHRSISSQSSVALDFVMRNKAKILKHYEARITPILHEHGQVLVLVRDVTDKVQMKKSLDRTMEDLKRSNEELEQFAYVASHDLQEPIRQVSSYLKLLVDSLQEPLEPKQLQYLVQAQESCLRMKKLVHDLLEFSKLNYDKRRTHRVNLNDLFSPILLTFDRLIRETSADIKIGRMPHVNCDPVLISQVFQNLISNSLKFHQPDRNPVICIDATVQNEYCYFEITDNGVGISERDQERIFAIFNRGSNSTGIEGAGIGMAICKKIIESHGGEIWVDKEYSNGTKISFTLRDAPYSN